jgi:hypothetical protein
MSEPLAVALAPVVRAFEKLGIDYYIGGSVAGMVHGEYRQTNDADIVADVRDEHVEAIIDELTPEYAIAAEDIRLALRHRRSFNVIHLDVFFKVDVFPVKGRFYDRVAMGRRARGVVDTDPQVEAEIATPEDILLAKIEWYRAGNEVSDRQWRDILGICKTKRDSLDFIYLQQWADELKVSDLLDRALKETGLNEQ